jgi:hypothetical protein
MLNFSIESDNIMNRKISQWIFNPFYYLAGFKALVPGIIIILITGYLGHLSNGRFNGLLDFHIGSQFSSIWYSLSDSIISWLLISILLLITGKIISKSRIRIIDIFGTQALARFPYLLIALAVLIPGLIPAFYRFIDSIIFFNNSSRLDIQDFMAFIFFIVIIIAAAVWMIALMYRAFAVSSNVSGRKAIIAFIVCLIIGEIISIVIISQISRLTGNRMVRSETSKFITQGSKITIQSKDTKTYSGRLLIQGSKFITLLSSGDYKTAVCLFNEEMKSALPEERLKSVWESLSIRFGIFKGQGRVWKEKIQIYDVVYITCLFERGSLNGKVVFDNKGMIAGLWFVP